MVAQLIAAGADVNNRCVRRGRPPLHYAAERGDYNIIRALALAGARRHALDSVKGQRAIKVAFEDSTNVTEENMALLKDPPSQVKG